MKRPSTSSDRRREQVAREAARLLARGAADVASARREAARRLGVHEPAALPSGRHVREALREYRALFGGGLDDAALATRRRAALEAMAALAAFDPRLAGPVLDGSAAPEDPVCLHLHADDPDAVARHLADQRISARQGRARARLGGRVVDTIPCWRLEAGGIPFELWVLPATAAREAPRDIVDDEPIERVGPAALARLLGP